MPGFSELYSDDIDVVDHAILHENNVLFQSIFDIYFHAMGSQQANFQINRGHFQYLMGSIFKAEMTRFPIFPYSYILSFIHPGVTTPACETLSVQQLMARVFSLDRRSHN